MKDLKTIKYIIIAAGVLASAAFYIAGGEGPGTIGYETIIEDETSPVSEERAEPGRRTDTGSGETDTGITDAEGTRDPLPEQESHTESGQCGTYTVELGEEQMAKLGELVRVIVREELTAVAEEGYLEKALQEAEEVRRSEAEAHQGQVNLNTAGRTELMTLPGIGEKKAEDILAYREAHGAFRDVEELMRINGIKEAAFEKLRDRVWV